MTSKNKLPIENEYPPDFFDLELDDNNHEDQKSFNEFNQSINNELQQFLNKNVSHFATPRVVTLCDFKVDWDRFNGSFTLKLDETTIQDSLNFFLDQSGKAKFYLPMFVSPLGVPASYRAINITDITDVAISRALLIAIPRIMGLGLNQTTGQEITYGTSIEDRIIDPVAMNLAKERIATGNYSVSMEIDQEKGVVKSAC